ncbi:MAG: recombination regulator RecX [Actinomycetia bacterium]|nr:recombination regulator RecX [Actinomycetes bacterium]
MAFAAKGARAARKRSSASEAFADPDGREPEADPVEVAKRIVMQQLSVSAKSRHQLAQVLAQRAVPFEAAEVALDRFTELGYIDDAVFARSWVESRQRSRSLAGPALRRELVVKGIDREIIDVVLLECVDDDAERVAAGELVAKKLRSMRGVDADTATRRLVSMLARKGYRPGLAYSVVREQLSLTSHR